MATFFKNRILLTNLVIGVALLSIPVLTSPDFGSNVSLLKINPFKRNLTGYLLLLSFFYANYYYFIPKFYNQKKMWLYGVVTLFCLVIIANLPSLIFDGNPSSQDYPGRPILPDDMPNGVKQPPFDLFDFRDTFIFQFLMVLALSLLLRLDNQLKHIKSEKLRSEVSYLKAQINPHFLFNTLNSIYALTLTKSDKAPKALLKLSDMMRYVVTESDTQTVPLEKEIAYITDYIDLQKLRMGDEVDFIYEVNGNPEGKQIAPIILINYVENAFKYGVNPDESSQIHILIAIDDKGVMLDVKNKITVEKSVLVDSTEEGAKNAGKRLEYRYHGKHSLNVNQSSETYHVKLYIQLV
ncbi:sensor histidine kinase [Flagellimonas okinawensis]|uniref:Histidine kinase n=1 Tax=Flagellimonas okinawensis TaxID=3031324 RepID=A0ABT5XT60_9FLAO|nr:sensor histidine kinase [[Muricauda] okinawensis]MDF0709079.1 histidine kinase [[Muricauda] okinawensis]